MKHYEYTPGQIHIGDRIKVHDFEARNGRVRTVRGEVTAIYEHHATVQCPEYVSAVNFKATNVPEWCQGRGGYK